MKRGFDLSLTLNDGSRQRKLGGGGGGGRGLLRLRWLRGIWWGEQGGRRGGTFGRGGVCVMVIWSGVAFLVGNYGEVEEEGYRRTRK